jgi:hydroxymethylglutaryl-CoA reductase
MALHARSVAIAAGAENDEVGAVAAAIAAIGNVTVTAAEVALKHIRSSGS